MSEDWSKKEVSLIVQDYFDMLRKELQQFEFSKTTHRKDLLRQLNSRSDGSIEFKHQNISAVLAKLGQPFIKGYKPRFNYQQILEEQVIKYLEARQEQLASLFETFASQVVSTAPLSKTNFKKCLEDGPGKSELKSQDPTFRTAKVNYLEREQNNRALGQEGEQFVIDYEKWRLTNIGRRDLIGEIEWTSKDKGDGAGYDILSKNEDGTHRFIEVKTTKLTKETPIYLSDNEVAFANKYSSNFYLYRVFNFDSQKKLFIMQGSYEIFCHLKPVVYKAIFAGG